MYFFSQKYKKFTLFIILDHLSKLLFSSFMRNRQGKKKVYHPIRVRATIPGRLEHFIFSFCAWLLIQTNGA
jgi:hypothetical protein